MKSVQFFHDPLVFYVWDQNLDFLRKIGSILDRYFICPKFEVFSECPKKHALDVLYKLVIISFEDAVPPLLEKLWSWSLAQVTIWQIVAANETCLKPLKNSSLCILMNSRTKDNISKEKYLIRSILYFEDLAYPVGQCELSIFLLSSLDTIT